VLYDAVTLLVSEDSAQALLNDPAVRDFISDAYVHAKFIGHVEAAAPLLNKAIGDDYRDGGFIELNGPTAAANFVRACRQLRFWEREDKVKP
jgi:catalase